MNFHCSIYSDINNMAENTDLVLKIAILAKIKDATDIQHSLSKGNWTESLSEDRRTESLSQDKRSYWVLNWVVFLFSTWSHYHYFSGWWSRSLEFKQTRRWLKRWLFSVYYFFYLVWDFFTHKSQFPLAFQTLKKRNI